jgi:tape measure domain-containing protein
MPDDLIFEFRTPTDKLKADLASARGEVRKFGADVQGDVSSFAENINGLLSSVGSKLNTGLSIALGDFGKAVDALNSIAEAGLRGIPVVGEGIAAAYHEVSSTLLDATERGLKWNDSLKQQQIQLGLVAGSAADVKRELAEISDIAFRTNVGRGFLVNAVEDLQLFNVEGRKALDLVRALATQATATGGGEGRVGALTDLIERVLETGKVDSRTVRQFIRQKVPIYDILADELQISKRRAMQLIQSGTLSGDDLIAVLTHAFTGPKWTQAAEEMTQTVEGMTRRYNTAVNKLLGVATQPIHATTVDFLRQAVETVRGPGAAGIASGIQSAITPVTSLLEQVGGALKSGDIFGGAVTAGQNITAGLARGIQDTAGAAVSAVKDLGSKGINALNDVWGSHSPSQVAADIGAMVVEGFTHGKGGQGGLASEESKAKVRAAVEELMREPAIQAFLKIIQRSELGAGERDPYGRAFGHGGHIDPNSLSVTGSDWYGERVFSPTLGRSVQTHAFGAYQFEPGTFREYARRLGLTDVSPRSQDMAAVLDLMSHRGAVPSILGGDVRGAMSATSNEWESFALRLKAGKTGDLQTLFNNLSVGGAAVSASNPVPVVVISAPAGVTSDLKGGVGTFAKSARASDSIGALGEDKDLLAGLQAMADAATLAGSHAKDAGVYIEGVGDVAQGEVIPALQTMFALMVDNQQAVQDFGQKGEEDLEKVRKRVNGLGESFREMGFTAERMGGIFETSFDDAFSHVAEGWKSVLKTFVLDWGRSIEEMIVKAEGANLAKSLFGSGGADGSGGILGGLLGGIKNLFTGGSAASSRSSTSGAKVQSAAGLLSLIGGHASSGASGPWVDPAAFTREFGEAPTMPGMSASAGFNFAGLGASGLMMGGGMLGGMLGRGAVGQMLGSAGGTLLGGSHAAALFNPALLPAMFSNPVTAIVSAGLVGGALLTRLLGNRHKTEKALQKAIQQAHGIDIKDMGVLGQIKQVGEAAFGKGQVSKHLAEVIQLAPVQQIIDDYAASTGQGKPTLPHEFTYNEIGGPSSSPISVNGSTLMSSPFSGSRPLADSGANGGSGPMAMVNDIFRRVEMMQAHTIGAIDANTRALQTITTASPEDVLVKGADTNYGQQAIGDALIRRSAENYDIAHTLLEHMGFAR